MSPVMIVQFVSFETILDSEQFLPKWLEYKRSIKSDEDVTMQQSVKEKGFRYIVQHRCPVGGPEFVFEKARRSSRIPETGITARLAGGYSILQSQRKNDVNANESKVFAFLTDPAADLEVYSQLASNIQLNVYEAYYENCKYSYILEFFLKNNQVTDFLEILRKYNLSEIGVYKKCALESV